MVLLLAFSLQDQVEKFGAYVGVGAFVGLAVLTLLYFSQARELRRLREWAGRAPERAQEIEARAVAQAEAALEAQAPRPAAAPAVAAAGPVAATAAAARSGTVGPATPIGALTREQAEAAALAAGAEGAQPATQVIEPATGGGGDGDGVEDGAGAPSANGSPLVAPEGEPAVARGTGAAGTAEAGPDDEPGIDAETGARDGDTAAQDGDTATGDGDTPAETAGTGARDGDTAARDGDTAADAAETAAGDGEPGAPAPSPSPPNGVPAGSAEAVAPGTPAADPSAGSSDTGEIPVAPVPRATPVPRRTPAPAAPLLAPSHSATVPPRHPQPPAPRRPLPPPPGEGSSSPRSARTRVLVVGLGALVLAACGFAATQLLGGDDGPPAPNRASAPTAEPSTGAGQAGALTPATTEVAVLNGTVTGGLASDTADKIAGAGFKRDNISTGNNTDQQRAASSVLYADGARSQARTVAQLLKISKLDPLDADTRSLANDADVVVILGADQTP